MTATDDIEVQYDGGDADQTAADGAVNGNSAQVVPEGSGGDNEIDRRVQEKFDHPAEYWLACIGYAVGFGNIWRFPYMVYSMGGAAFLIPYLISLFFIAMPMHMVETLYGQLIRTKLQQRYGVINKMWWAIALTQLATCFFTTIYYVTLMAWSFSYFFDSWKNPFPWVYDDKVWAEKSQLLKKQQQAELAKLSDAKKIAELKASFKGLKASNLWNPDFFYKTTLERTENIDTTGSLNGRLVFCLFLSYVILYFSAWKGVKSTGKMVWVTCTLPYVILTILFIKGLTLEGAGKGLKFLFIPEWSKLGEAKIWQQAGIQILFSSGVAFGPLIYYGGARHRNEKILKASFWIPLANSATSFYAALTVFTFIGHVANQLGVEIKDVSTSGTDLAFVAYPGLLNLLPGKNFWAIIFYLMFVSLGVDSAFGYIDYFMEYFLDTYPQILQKMRKEIVCIFMVTLCWLSGFIFCLGSGYYTFNMFDSYACGINLYFCLMMECLLIAWWFGIEKLDVILQKECQEKIPLAVKLCTKYFIPLFTFINCIMYFINEFSSATAKDRNWSTGLTWLGRLLWIIPILSAFIGLIPHPMTRPDSANVYDLIEEQHGIRFSASKFGDHEHNWDGQPAEGAAPAKGGDVEMTEKSNAN